MILNRCTRPDGETWTKDDCAALLGEWFKIYKGVKKFQDDCVEEARATGLARESVSGRIIYLPAVWSPVKYVRQTAERMSYVMHTQGGAASLIKKCLAAIWKEVCKHPELGVEPLLWVHDELLVEMPEDPCLQEIVDNLMVEILCNTVKLRVPVKASGGYGPSWLAAH
jgi:DNA polymerase I